MRGKPKDGRTRSDPSRGSRAPGIAAGGEARGPGMSRPAPNGDAILRARALARWENEGGRVLPAEHGPRGGA